MLFRISTRRPLMAMALAKLVTPSVESRQGTATECVCRFQPQLDEAPRPNRARR